MAVAKELRVFNCASKTFVINKIFGFQNFELNLCLEGVNLARSKKTFQSHEIPMFRLF